MSWWNWTCFWSYARFYSTFFLLWWTTSDPSPRSSQAAECPLTHSILISLIEGWCGWSIFPGRYLVLERYLFWRKVGRRSISNLHLIPRLDSFWGSSKRMPLGIRLIYSATLAFFFVVMRPWRVRKIFRILGEFIICCRKCLWEFPNLLNSKWI